MSHTGPEFHEPLRRSPPNVIGVKPAKPAKTQPRPPGLTKARITHRCMCCRLEIEPGTYYAAHRCHPWSHSNNEGFGYIRLCRFCDHMRAQLCLDEDDGFYPEALQESILQHFFDQAEPLTQGVRLDDLFEIYADPRSPWHVTEQFIPCTFHDRTALHYTINNSGQKMIRCTECARTRSHQYGLDWNFDPKHYSGEERWYFVHRDLIDHPTRMPRIVCHALETM